MRRTVSRAVAAATGARTGDPGPVHLDLAFREPLVPGDAPWPEPSTAGLTLVQARHVRRPCPPPRVPCPPSTPAAPPRHGRGGVATVLVAGRRRRPGRAPARRGQRLAAAGGAVVRRPRRHARDRGLPPPAGAPAARGSGPAGRRPRPAHPVPARAAPARPAGRRGRRHRARAAGTGPTPRATRATSCSTRPRACGRAGCPHRPAGSTRGGPPTQAAGAAIDAVLDGLDAGRRSRSGTRVTGPALARVVAQVTGADDALVVGSSNPVRDLDLVARWDTPPVVLANRGLAGIDGTVSTAVGVALGLPEPSRPRAARATSRSCTTSAACCAARSRRQVHLQLVVANDDGGSIFATLEPGEPRRGRTCSSACSARRTAPTSRRCARATASGTPASATSTACCPRSPHPDRA